MSIGRWNDFNSYSARMWTYLKVPSKALQSFNTSLKHTCWKTYTANTVLKFLHNKSFGYSSSGMSEMVEEHGLAKVLPVNVTWPQNVKHLQCTRWPKNMMQDFQYKLYFQSMILRLFLSLSTLKICFTNIHPNVTLSGWTGFIRLRTGTRWALVNTLKNLQFP